MDTMLATVDVIIGMDVIRRLGCSNSAGDNGKADGEHVVFGCAAFEEDNSNHLTINYKDFDAIFDGKSEGEPTLINKMTQFRMDPEVESRFDAEVKEWIANGWLVAYDEPCDGILPLMAVVQEQKNKVRPVMDYREVNRYVESHTAASAVCDETLRRWRKMSCRFTMLDLRSTYLQLHVDPKLWRYQVVQFKGVRYCLTRLGFGLNCAPRVMSLILKKVLSIDPIICKATDHYIDDIFVNEDMVTAFEVSAHLQRYGLEAKPPKDVENSKVLGLQPYYQDGVLGWRRGNRVPDADDVSDVMTKRQLFSVCGQLLGHYPVARWLRVACSYVKRKSEGKSWNDSVGAQTVQRIKEVLQCVAQDDPVAGVWNAVGGVKGGVV